MMRMNTMKIIPKLFLLKIQRKKTIERVRGGMRLSMSDIRVVGNSKSCVHDEIINEYYQMGFPINKKIIQRDKPIKFEE